MEPITIERVEKHGWVVRQGDRYADWLGWDEMLGLIIFLTAPKDFSRASWMKTEEQHQMTEPWRYREGKPKETLLLTMK